MAQKLEISDVLAAMNRKDYAFYSSLSEEEQKAFTPFVVMRFAANAVGDRDIQEWFLESTHELVNKYHWDLSKNHKELLWLLYAAVGAGMPCRHQYLAAAAKEKTSKIEGLIASLNPAMKLSDVKLMASIMDRDDRAELYDSLGFDDKERKKYE